jgi:hypothetical protein
MAVTVAEQPRRTRAWLRILLLEYGGMAVVSAVGIAWLALAWRASRRRTPAPRGWRVPIPPPRYPTSARPL